MGDSFLVDFVQSRHDLEQYFVRSAFGDRCGLKNGGQKRAKTAIRSDQNDGIGIVVIEDFVQMENVGMIEHEHDGNFLFKLLDRAGTNENRSKERFL